MLDIRFSGLVLAWCITSLAGAAAAHDQRIAMDGDSVEVAFGGAPSRFHFAGSGPGIGVVHDPRIGGGFAFLVHGVGPGTGRSELVRLDATRWSFDPADDSYSYLDPSAARQGVYLARYASGEIQLHALEG